MSLWIGVFVAAVWLLVFTARRRFSHKGAKAAAVVFEICLCLYVSFRVFFPCSPPRLPRVPRR